MQTNYLSVVVIVVIVVVVVVDFFYFLFFSETGLYAHAAPTATCLPGNVTHIRTFDKTLTIV